MTKNLQTSLICPAVLDIIRGGQNTSIISRTWLESAFTAKKNKLFSYPSQRNSPWKRPKARR